MDRLTEVLMREIEHFFRDGVTSWDFEDLAHTLASVLRAEGFADVRPQMAFGIAQEDVPAGSLVRVELLPSSETIEAVREVLRENPPSSLEDDSTKRTP